MLLQTQYMFNNIIKLDDNWYGKKVARQMSYYSNIIIPSSLTTVGRLYL